MKKNHIQQDEQFKSLLNQEQRVPAGFEWENMDISFPQKKDRRRGLILWFFSGLFILSAVAVLTINSFDSNKTSENIQSAQATEKTANENKMPSPVSNETSLSKKEVEKAVSPNSSKTIKAKQPLKSIKEKTIQQSKNTPVKIEKDIYTSAFKTSSANSNGLTREKVESKDSYPAFSSSAPLETKIAKHLRLNPLSYLGTIGQIELPSRPLIIIQKPSLFKLPEINESCKTTRVFVSSGVNSIRLNRNAEISDIGTVSESYGMSNQLGIQQAIGKGLFVSASVNYELVHSIFQSRRFINSELNFAGSSQIHRYEVTYHNNYAHLVGLELSLGKNFNLYKNLGLSLAPFVGANKVVSNSGKIGSNDEVLLLENVEFDQKLSFNSGLNLNVNYQMNNRWNVGLSYGYQIQLTQQPWLSTKENLSGINRMQILLARKF